jgi:hypothetical protein
MRGQSEVVPDQRYENRSFERLLAIAEAHYPHLVYVTNSKTLESRGRDLTQGTQATIRARI